MNPYWQSDCNGATVYLGDCREVLPTLEPNTFDAVVTDPPYGLGFMGKEWDHGIPGVPFWQPVLRVLKPGGYMLAMGGTRTYHRLTCAIEDAGFEIRDCIMWLYGSGFPKGKGCLKPAYEPILLCRKPGPNVMPLEIDECRIPASQQDIKAASVPQPTMRPNGMDSGYALGTGHGRNGETFDMSAGRWPANVTHDGSDEVLEAFAAFGEMGGGFGVRGGRQDDSGWGMSGTMEAVGYGDTGTAARFFYCAKADANERPRTVAHPTVKPLDLMKWLVRLVCPKGGMVLDPFTGSGTTGCACVEEGRQFVGVEKEKEYADGAIDRLKETLGVHPTIHRSASGKRTVKDTPPPPEAW